MLAALDHRPRGEGAASAPPLDGVLLVRLANAGFETAADRLVATAARDEIARERARFVALAALLLGGDLGTLPRRMWQRARELRRVRYVEINLSTIDGCLRAVLLITRGIVPNRSTFHRDLDRRAPRLSAVQSVPSLR